MAGSENARTLEVGEDVQTWDTWIWQGIQCGL